MNTATDRDDSLFLPARTRKDAPKNTFLQNKANLMPESHFPIRTCATVINRLERSQSRRNFGFDLVPSNLTTAQMPTLAKVRA